jgi:hypothetical protein
MQRCQAVPLQQQRHQRKHFILVVEQLQSPAMTLTSNLKAQDRTAGGGSLLTQIMLMWITVARMC